MGEDTGVSGAATTSRCLVSKILPGGVLSLGKGQILRLGRRPDNDLVLPDLAVSRRHARFAWRKADLFVRDLNSRSGTFVNGVRISDQRIGDGDEVTIGPYTLRYREGVEDVSALKAVTAIDCEETQEIATPDFLHPGALPAGTSVHFVGNVTKAGDLIKVCRYLSLNRQHGTLKLEAVEEGGTVEIRCGEIETASCGKEEGVPAARRLLSADHGLFIFEGETPEKEGTVQPLVPTLSYLDGLWEQLHGDAPMVSPGRKGLFGTSEFQVKVDGMFDWDV